LPDTVLNICMLLHCIICRNVRDTGTAGRPPIHLDIEQLTYFIGNLDSAQTVQTSAKAVAPPGLW